MSFVYKWIQISTNKWYIGSRTAKGCNIDDGYICSSKIVKPMILENPADWNRIILEIGDTKDIVQLEYELLTCLNAAKSEYSYNRHNGGKFSNTGKSHSTETRLKMSISAKAHPHNFTGKKHSLETKMKMGKPKSEEHKAKIGRCGLVMLKHIYTGQCVRIPKSEVANYDNLLWKNPAALKARILVICPHCYKEGDISNMKRWHFDNCKININNIK